MRKPSRFRLWYRFLRRHTRGLRRVCITVFSVALMASRVVETAVKLLDIAPF